MFVDICRIFLPSSTTNNFYNNIKENFYPYELKKWLKTKHNIQYFSLVFLKWRGHTFYFEFVEYIKENKLAWLRNIIKYF